MNPASTDRLLSGRALKWGLFILWPIIACVLVFCVVIVCAFAWLMIPFGLSVWDDNSWSLKFPWSKS